jgi:1-acyl-sn-glycerol-3-phosphate acyltransferase
MKMQKVINYILRILVKIALRVFYWKIEVVGKEKKRINKATIIVANHQNALIDPLLVATHSNLKPHFLARASAFSSPLIGKLLEVIRMIPVYRIRDGKENMSKNQKTFDLCSKILSDNETVLIFIEGNHSHERGLRPLKRGFLRIIEQTLEKHPELAIDILPVGINYSNLLQSGSKVSLYFGERIHVVKEEGSLEHLMNKTYESLFSLVTYIPPQDYEKHLKELIEYEIPLNNPFAVQEFLSNQSIKKDSKNRKSQPYLMNKLMKIYHFPVYVISKAVVKNIKDPVFTGTLKFIIGWIGVPIWYFLVYQMASTYGFNFFISVLIMGPISLYFNRTRQS